MGKTNLTKIIYLKSALKCDSFDVAISIKIIGSFWYPFFRVLITIEPGRSLLQFVITNCLIPRILQTRIFDYMAIHSVFLFTLQVFREYIIGSM